jgi:hypothetical protein
MRTMGEPARLPARRVIPVRKPLVPAPVPRVTAPGQKPTAVSRPTRAPVSGAAAAATKPGPPIGKRGK